MQVISFITNTHIGHTSTHHASEPRATDEGEGHLQTVGEHVQGIVLQGQSMADTIGEWGTG